MYFIAPAVTTLSTAWTTPPRPFAPTVRTAFAVSTPTYVFYSTTHVRHVIPFSFISAVQSESSSRGRSVNFDPSSEVPTLFAEVSALPCFSVAESVDHSKSPFFRVSIRATGASPPTTLVSSTAFSDTTSLLTIVAAITPSLTGVFTITSPAPRLPPMVVTALPFGQSVSGVLLYYCEWGCAVLLSMFRSVCLCFAFYFVLCVSSGRVRDLSGLSLSLLRFRRSPSF